ncbi:methyltransferase domain-containing protein [Ktedonosporobacter rubrisoli]|uniref:Methyltransferase domain-containing protein n=1 Tax=Ktedonosporobacter rubrisoli TaxID=2509675 RepID=A0A4P6JWZ8_KTERU|nr:methyltransferase domain-containing protein [Ktedonosporobacter rubrisoli]QBD80257.1 methyltransferase domain-containing protein [Ktedonosporobacter rubrisoli]
MPEQAYPIVLSYIQAATLLEARKQGRERIELSPDLGISTVNVTLTPEGVTFPCGEQLNWRQIEKIRKAESNCFVIEDNQERTIQVFSEATSRVCSLYPTQRTPTMLIGGFTMHRIVDIDPMQDTLKKIKTLAPLAGRVLDTATGLGYTAIEAARTAQEVMTIELDPGAQEIARLNPWSRQLFTDPKIKQVMGDAFEVVPEFESESFERIIHDPPVFSLAGELYGGEFYRQLYRVLKRGGRLFHYIGNLESRSSGTVARGALKRLQEAGFKRVVRRPEAFGILAYK